MNLCCLPKHVNYLTISASQFLPLAIHMTSALNSAINTLVSPLGVQLVHCTHCQSFPRLSGFDVACNAQQPILVLIELCLSGRAAMAARPPLDFSSSFSTNAGVGKRPLRWAPSGGNGHTSHRLPFHSQPLTCLRGKRP